jgi:hypothetical protein
MRKGRLVSLRGTDGGVIGAGTELVSVPARRCRTDARGRRCAGVRSAHAVACATDDPRCRPDRRCVPSRDRRGDELLLPPASRVAMLVVAALLAVPRPSLICSSPAAHPPGGWRRCRRSRALRHAFRDHPSQASTDVRMRGFARTPRDESAPHGSYRDADRVGRHGDMNGDHSVTIASLEMTSPTAVRVRAGPFVVDR